MIAEVADILLRDDQTNWVMVTGYFKHKMIVSLRTYEENVRADKIIHGIVARKGTGGGHPSYAGGQIPLKDNTKRTKDRLEKTVLSRFLKQVVKDSVPKQPLIQK
jgi:nanoRNase/pAp phosphatase (c-di-AMP/oligoRNAs hydrolase)